MSAFLYIKSQAINKSKIIDIELKDLENCLQNSGEPFRQKRTLKYISTVKMASKEYGLRLVDDEPKSFEEKLGFYIENLLTELEGCPLLSQLGMDFRRPRISRTCWKIFKNDQGLQASFSSRKVKHLAVSLIYISLRICDVKVT